MAGFTRDEDQHGVFEFHIGDPDIAKKIRRVTNNRPVVNLQLDGDELDAALWGLENYKK